MPTSMKSEPKNERCRKFSILLYPDNPLHVEAFEKIRRTYDHIGILHDKDTKSDGSLKKAHWHIVLVFRNDRWSTAVSKEFGIERRWVEAIRNQESMLYYLIHFKEEKKHQYDIKELFGTESQLKNFSKLYQKGVEGYKDEGEKIVELIEFIENADKHISVKSFSKFCALNGYWSEFRRSGSIFLKMIEEKNKELSNE